MPRSRFQLISSIISFDNRDLRQYIPADRKNFYKISEILYRFKNNIGEAVRPGEFLTIDEELYSYRGILLFYFQLKLLNLKFYLFFLILSLFVYIYIITRN